MSAAVERVPSSGSSLENTSHARIAGNALSPTGIQPEPTARVAATSTGRMAALIATAANGTPHLSREKIPCTRELLRRRC